MWKESLDLFKKDETHGQLAHTAYLDALRTMASTQDEWRAILAGFLVLRLIDAWLVKDSILTTRDMPEVQAVQEALNNIPENHPIRPALCEIVEMILESERIHIRVITSQVLQYGVLLYKRGRWHLAENVFASILRHAHDTHDTHSAVEAARQLACAWRHLGRLDQAEHLYLAVINVAHRINNVRCSIRAHLGLEELCVERGNTGRAEQLLDAAEKFAVAYSLTDLLSEILLDRSALHYTRQDYLRAIQLNREALQCVTDKSVHNLLLNNLGTCFMQLGDLHSSKKLFLGLSTDTDENIRQIALLNLLETAAWESDEENFRLYRHELVAVITLPRLQTHYSLFLAQGFLRFGQPRMAIEELHTAASIASAYGLESLRIEVEDYLTMITKTH